jgi:cell wall assembly regulator SMI1
MTLRISQSEAFWDRIDNVLQRRAPELFAALNPPATIQQIEDAEKQLGLALPQDVRDAYLRHNGSPSADWLANSPHDFTPDFFVNWGFWCSLEEMVRYWQGRVKNLEYMRAVNPDIFPDYAPYWDTLKVRPEWWNRHWVPIGLTKTMTTIYIDMQPAPLGVPGQVIQDNGMADAGELAPSLGDYLVHLIDHLDNGRLIYDASRGGYIDTLTNKEAYWWFWLKKAPQPG